MTEDTFEANGATFLAKDDMIVRHIRSGKAFEPDTTKWLFANLDPDRTYVDVGHSTGWFAIPVAMKGHKVIGFEPLPNSYERSLENMKLNGVEYELINAAVSSKSGERKLRYNPKLPLTSGASLEEKIHGGPEKMDVDVVTLDKAIPKDVDVGFLKVDVEGHEINVLRGAVKMITRCRPKMVLEANTPDKVEELTDWLAENDYLWKIRDSRNLICVPE
jgi:FkbM family methyltransferase